MIANRKKHLKIINRDKIMWRSKVKNRKLTLLCSIGLVLVLVLSTILAACAKEEAPAAPALPTLWVTLSLPLYHQTTRFLSCCYTIFDHILTSKDHLFKLLSIVKNPYFGINQVRILDKVSRSKSRIMRYNDKYILLPFLLTNFLPLEMTRWYCLVPPEAKSNIKNYN